MFPLCLSLDHGWKAEFNMPQLFVNVNTVTLSYSYNKILLSLREAMTAVAQEFCPRIKKAHFPAPFILTKNIFKHWNLNQKQIG